MMERDRRLTGSLRGQAVRLFLGSQPLGLSLLSDQLGGTSGVQYKLGLADRKARVACKPCCSSPSKARASLHWHRSQTLVDATYGLYIPTQSLAVARRCARFALLSAQRSVMAKAIPLIFGGGAFGAGMYQSDEGVSWALALLLKLRHSRFRSKKQPSPCGRPSVTVYEVSMSALGIIQRELASCGSIRLMCSSESIIGQALAKLSDEFPRDSYALVTKCGRYTKVDGEMFQYDPDRLRWSIERSLQLLQTDYLDVLYLHDVEFVAEAAGKANQAGFPCGALHPMEASRYGLAKADASRILGPGDQAVLEAVKVMQEFKAKGRVKKVGISGYPLPTLLRLAILIKHHLKEPLDIILSYGTHGLRSVEAGQAQSNLERFLPHFIERAGVQNFMAASPFEMGLLASPPPWHPAPQELKDELAALGAKVDLPTLALRYATRPFSVSQHPNVPVLIVIGWTNPDQVQASLKAYARAIERRPEDVEEEQAVIRELQGLKEYSAGWVWQSGRLAEGSS
jgi:D-arabinose 1-dehydrogenase